MSRMPPVTSASTGEKRMAYVDPCDVSPHYYKKLFENEKLRVVEMTLPPGHKDTQHSHPDETVYFISGGKARIYVGDDAMEVDIPDGHVMHHESWTHTVENIGDTTINAIIFEPHMDTSHL
ncbi:MAG: cupin domain-containing protein [Gemmatimonadales bacterium]|nr:cupin domain-containing protein [Gemmatimonadales bacterium]